MCFIVGKKALQRHFSLWVHATLFTRLPFIFILLFFKMKDKLFSKIHFFALSALLFMASCDLSTDDPFFSTNTFEKGVFVVNEGSFNGSGTITFYDPESGEVIQDLFAAVNNGAALGQFVQSITFYNNLGYIVVNGANKVVVVNGSSFEQIGVIEGFEQPRFFLPVSANFAYVSQWGADGLTGSVVKVNIGTLQIVKTIPVGKGPEKMWPKGTDVYVANSGGFGLDSTVSIINTLDDTEKERRFAGGYNPASVAAFNNTSGVSLTYALCRGDWNATTPQGLLGDLNNGGAGFNTVPGGDDLCTAPEGNKMYFIGGGAVWSVNQFAVSKLYDQNAYGLACDPASGNLYIADAKDFSSNGEVVIYGANGGKISSFQAGVSPNEVVFR